MHHKPSNQLTASTTPRQAPGGPRGTLRSVAGAVALVTALTAGNAWALALGRVSVQSLLGEPLRAEIDVPSITPDEAASLQIGVAPLERFRAASMDYNPLLGDLAFELVQRPDGRTVVRMRSNRVVNEPFLDLVLQASWANGQLLRGYTLLFDPPNLRAAAAAPLLPAVTAPARASSPPPASATAATPPRATAPARPSAPAAAAPGPAADTATRQVQVVRGDTAGRIAAAHKPAEVSLEQMLVGLLRANPSAFAGQNVNRLKAGVVLDLPDSQSVAAIDPQEARRLISAQSRDFNEYRRRLAAATPTQAAPERAAAGQVQTEVTDTRPTEAAADKLTLSKAADAARDSAEAQIAQARQRDAAADRQQELARNLEQLEQLRASTGPADAPPPPTDSPTEPTAAPALPVAPPLPVPAPEPAPAPAPASTPPTAPPPAASAGFLAELLGHPWALPGAGGAAALLGLLVLLRLRQRKAAALPDDDSPDAAQSEAEGQSVDTSEDAPVSSMMYSPSQLDAGGDVDPVAEADVYLAYGRDQQAEEILREALRLHPDRLPVRAKLLEILAQRADTDAYHTEAQALYDLTFGEGPEWAAARDAGRVLDPANPLYQAGAPTAAPAVIETPDIDLGFGESAQAAEPSTDTAGPATEPAPTAAAPSADIDFDFDLTAPHTPAEPAVDLDLDTASAPANVTPPEPAREDDGLAFDLDLTAAEPASAEAPAPVAAPAAADTGLDFDFDLSEVPSTAPAEVPAPAELPAEVRDLSLDLDLDGLDNAAPASAATATTSPDPLADFDDLSSLEVDEGGSADPLETKLSLAREFEAIGDADGARSLAEEVEVEATGDLQARARAFLAQLG